MIRKFYWITCIISMATRKSRIEHGLSKHPLYRKWQDMVYRCHNPNHRNYPWYGGTGVTVCQEWRDDAKAFIDWAIQVGWKPGMDIDKDTKIANNRVYSPDTCLFISHRENMTAVVGRESGRKTAKLILSVADVQQIVARKDAGELSSDLAKEFGVAHNTINRVYRLRK